MLKKEAAPKRTKMLLYEMYEITPGWKYLPKRNSNLSRAPLQKTNPFLLTPLMMVKAC